MNHVVELVEESFSLQPNILHRILFWSIEQIEYKWVTKDRGSQASILAITNNLTSCERDNLLRPK